MVRNDILVRFRGIAGKTTNWARCQAGQKLKRSSRKLERSQVKMLDLRSGSEGELIDSPRQVFRG